MRMKMTSIGGTMVLVVSGTNQALIIQEEDDGFVVEFVDTTHSAASSVAAPTAPQTTNAPSPVVQDDTPQAPLNNELFQQLAQLRKPTVPQATNAPPPVVQDNTPQAPSDNGLFQKLVQLRKQLAVMEQVAPYLIFHDKTLREMADKVPMNMQEMGNISGVGHTKLEKYGPVFLEAIHGVAV